MASLIRELGGAVAMGLRAPLAVRLRDIGLFMQSSRTDAEIATARGRLGARGAFEAAYTVSADPWRSVSPRYRYQRRKYEVLASLLPAGQRYASTLDLGSGLGAMARLLSPLSGRVLGVDLAQAAVDRANAASAGYANVAFRQGDVTALPHEMNAWFDLVVVADTLYYLPALDDDALDGVVTRIADLLTPGGTVMVANHYFTRWDRDSRLSRRIHDRFIQSADFKLTSEHRRPFYLASLLRLNR